MATIIDPSKYNCTKFNKLYKQKLQALNEIPEQDREKRGVCKALTLQLPGQDERDGVLSDQLYDLKNEPHLGTLMAILDKHLAKIDNAGSLAKF